MLMHVLYSLEKLKHNLLRLRFRESWIKKHIILQITKFAVLHCYAQTAMAFVPAEGLDETMHVLT